MGIFRHTEKHRQYLCFICNMSCYRGNKSIDDYIGFDFPKSEPEIMDLYGTDPLKFRMCPPVEIQSYKPVAILVITTISDTK